MTRNLCRVFACIGVGSTEDAHQYFVDDLRTIFDMSVVDGIGLSLSEIPGEDMRKNLKRLRA
jgi:hypothetical protein